MPLAEDFILLLEMLCVVVIVMNDNGTFTVDPKFAHEFPEDYLERVRKVHSEGGYGSQG